MKNFNKYLGVFIFLFPLHIFTQVSAQESSHNLSDFSITRMEDQVILDWSVAEKTPPSTFEVQRASDTYLFETIATIHQAENDPSYLNFEFRDTDPPAGLVQYRIKQISQQGAIHLHEVLSLKLDDRGNKMEISRLKTQPQQISFHLSNPSSAPVLMRLNSLNGQMIAERKIASGNIDTHISFALSPISKGMYMLILSNPAGDIIKEKILY